MTEKEQAQYDHLREAAECLADVIDTDDPSSQDHMVKRRKRAHDAFRKNYPFSQADEEKRGIPLTFFYAARFLLTGAKNLRKAQKAYMDDRGNNAKGQIVAKKAEELDLRIEQMERNL